MSLFGAILKQGAKFADEAFDASKMQAKHVEPKRSRKKAADRTPEEQEAHRLWERENYERRKEQIRKNAAARRDNPEARAKAAANARKWREENPEKQQAIKDRAASASEEVKAERARKERERQAEIRATETPEEAAARRAAKNEAKKKRVANETPEQRSRRLAQGRKDAAIARAERAKRNAPWADREQIDDIYRQAEILSNATGTPYEVDHIMPLQGTNVSGLHHQDNLMIMPRNLNRGKSNLFDLDTVLPPPRKRR